MALKGITLLHSCNSELVSYSGACKFVNHLKFLIQHKYDLKHQIFILLKVKGKKWDKSVLFNCNRIKSTYFPAQKTTGIYQNVIGTTCLWKISRNEQSCFFKTPEKSVVDTEYMLKINICKEFEPHQPIVRQIACKWRKYKTTVIHPAVMAQQRSFQDQDLYPVRSQSSSGVLLSIGY